MMNVHILIVIAFKALKAFTLSYTGGHFGCTVGAQLPTPKTQRHVEIPAVWSMLVVVKSNRNVLPIVVLWRLPCCRLKRRGNLTNYRLTTS